MEELFLTEIRVILLILLALGSASISFTISFTSIFKPVRELISKIHPKFEEWIHCPWCLNHWILLVFLLLLNIPVLPFTSNTILDFIFTFFILTSFAGPVHYVLLRAYEPVAKSTLIRDIEKLKKNS